MTLLVYTFPPTDRACFRHSELGLQSTPDDSNLVGKSTKLELAGARVIGSSKKITANKKKSKWMGREI